MEYEHFFACKRGRACKYSISAGKVSCKVVYVTYM